MSIRGSVVNLPPRSSAAIMLQSRDFSLVLNGAEMHQDGSFVIRDVAPGSYTILATVENGSTPMMARQALQIVSNNVEDLRLSPQPGGWVHGRLRVENRNGGRFDPSQIFLQLRSADGDDDVVGGFSSGDGFSHVAHMGADGSFEWKGVPPGNYSVQLAGDGGASGDLFLKSVLSGSRDLGDAGISVNGGAVVLDLVASANGGVVDGVVGRCEGAAGGECGDRGCAGVAAAWAAWSGIARPSATRVDGSLCMEWSRETTRCLLGRAWTARLITIRNF